MRGLNWIDATDLNQWADRRDAQSQLPQVIRRLVHATIGRPHRVDFAAGEGVQLGGWDGIVDVFEGNAFVPDGLSCWELGTSRKIKEKADGDYQKRCKDPLGLNPSTSTFVFVTPRRWSNKEDWIKGKNDEGVWAEVRAYDADNLEQWLELAPAVHAWLALLLGKWPEGAQDLSDYWDEWRQSTTPPMSTGLILAGRQKAVERIVSWMDDAPSVLPVQSGSREESIAAFAATLFQLSEEDRLPYLARCVIARDEQAWQYMVPNRERLILIPAFGDPEGVVKAVSRGHHVLIPLGRESIGSQNALELARPTPAHFKQALEEMGVNEDRAHVLTRESRRSLLVLRRRLSTVPEIYTPAWAKAETGGALVPILLAGAWDETVESDREAVSKMARRPYEEVQAILTRWVNEADAPVRQVGSVWQLISREDSWHLLVRFIGRDDLEAFSDVVLAVLGTLDPRYELPPDDRWAAGLYEKRLPHSAFLRRGLAETLALLATRGDGIQGIVSAQGRASTIVYKLLKRATDWRLWAALSGLLPTLAEAAPEVFLEAVEDTLSSESPILKGVFAEEGPFGGSPHTGLLWALEVLAWAPEYLSRVALALARLASLDPGGKLMNRPQNSLREIFLCWHPQTLATLEQRLRVIDTLLSREPNVSWKLIYSLLPSGTSDVSTPIQQPQWRELATEWSPGVPYAEYWRSIEELAKRMLCHVGTSGQRWQGVLNRLSSMPPALRDEAIERLLAAEPGSMGVQDRLEIWKALRATIHRHRRFADAKWALPQDVVDKLYRAYQKFEPDDLSARFSWLFTWQPELPDPPGRDWRAADDAAGKARADAVVAIYTAGGLSGLLDMAAAVELPQHVGMSIGKSEIAQAVERELLSVTLGRSKRHFQILTLGFVRARFQTCGWTWAEEILSLATEHKWSACFCQLKTGPNDHRKQGHFGHCA